MRRIVRFWGGVIPGSSRPAFRSEAKIGRDHVGTVAAIILERWPRSNRNGGRNGPDFPAPTLDVEKRKLALRELGYIGNNLNQLTKAMYVRGFESIKDQLLDSINDIRLLKHYLGLDYGNR